TINRQVGSMLKQGLVERVPDPEGGIARKIRASAEGLAQLAHDRAQSREGIGSVVADWDDADVEQLSKLVARFNASIEAKENNPWPRP
ncbi:MarR family winged helix-turn-helix transcriptional regulator, partial [Streptomyces roseolus]|uniref:MarR family winged helix-turn-helix transcriptional regulator n=1 Tax=Streptomyces roseolus TaxID=67358 RepID=UPI003651349F